MELLEQTSLERDEKPIQPQKADWLLAALVILSAYVYYSCWMPFSWLYQTVVERYHSSLLFFFTVLFAVTGLCYARIKNRRLGKESMVYLVLTAAAALWFVIYQENEQPIGLYMLLFLHAAAVYWLLALAGNRRTGRLDEWSLPDLLRGLFRLPFAYFGKLTGTIGNLVQSLLRSRRQNPQIYWQILFGAAMSIPVLCIVIPLLISADHAFFQAAVHSLDHFWGIVDFMTWLKILLVACIAMYLFGLFFGAFNSQPPSSTARTVWPPLILGSFLGVILMVYFVFFAVKISSVSTLLAQIETGELLTSTYARDGFFELCAIAAINFGLFAVVKWYTPVPGTPMKVILTTLGVQTLAFICLAFSKMNLYIQTYGFTFKRIFTTWFMAVLFVSFVLLIVQLWKSFQAIRIAVLFAAVTFLLLAYSNMPAWIAAYNAVYHPEAAVLESSLAMWLAV